MKPSIVYSPENRAGAKIFEPVTSLVSQIYRWRWHIGVNFIRDFKAPFANAGFGVLWSILLPLTPVGAYTFLFIALRPETADGLHPAVFVTLGVTIWFLLADLVTSVISTIANKSGAVGRTAYPLFAAIVSDLGTPLFEFTVRLTASVAVLVALHGAPEISGLLAIPILLTSAPLFVGLGLILGVLNAVNRDVGMITIVISRYGLFVSSAIFPLQAIAPGALGDWLVAVNPFAFFIEFIRSLLVGAPLDVPVFWAPALAAYLAASVLIFMLGARLFYITEYDLRGGAA